MSPLPLLNRLSKGDWDVTPFIVRGTLRANSELLKLNFWEENVIVEVPAENDIAPVEVKFICAPDVIETPALPEIERVEAVDCKDILPPEVTIKSSCGTEKRRS